MKTNILGCKISNVESFESVYSNIKSAISEDKAHYITVNNVHTVIEGFLNSNYQDSINNAFMALPDGKPLSVVSKIKGYKDSFRIFGPTLMEKTLEWGQKDKLKHFVFGSCEETINKMKAMIQKKYPEAEIVGMISPPYRPFTDSEVEEYFKLFNKSKADIIWVGLGAPKQEIWMYENYKKLDSGIMIGIGAGFDYLAGKTKHAPEWMKNYSLEWLYRLVQEPKRLWKRYLVTNSLFIALIIAEFLGIKRFGNHV